jgi:predicted RNase H-like HicB family nuclease
MNGSEPARLPAIHLTAARRAPQVRPMEIILTVTPCAETGGFVARWDAPAGGGITKQGETLAELQTMINDAVLAYFGPGTAPARVRLHFTQDPVLAVA